MILSNDLVGAVTVPPSRIQPGDTIASVNRLVGQPFTVHSVGPIEILRWGEPVQVWFITGYTGHRGNRPPNVKTVCVPGQHWYLLRRTK